MAANVRSESQNTPTSIDNAGTDPVPMDAKIIQITENEDGSRTYKYDVDEHVKALVANVRNLWRRKEFTDVILVSSEKKTYRYHSVMLASCSSVFRELLSGTQMQFYRGTLAPHDVSAKMLEVLQDYLYRPDAFIQYQGDPGSLHSFCHYFGIEEMAVNGIMDTEKFLQNLGSLYSSRRLAFGVLSSEGVEFPCHSVIIAAAVPFLKPFLIKSDIGEDQLENLYKPLPVDDTTAQCLQGLLNYIYYAEVIVDEDIVEDLLQTSAMMRIPSVAKACCDFLTATVNVSTVLIYREYVRKALRISPYDIFTGVKNELDRYVIDNFSLVIHEEAFNLIDNENDLISFLAKADLADISLTELIDVLTKWCFCTDDRKANLPALMSLLALLKEPKELLKVITQAEKESKNPDLAIITTAFKGTTGTTKLTKKKQHSQQ